MCRLDLPLNLRDDILRHCTDVPIFFRFADRYEIPEQPLAPYGMRHFGMELDAVTLAHRMHERGVFACRRRCCGHEPARQRGYRIAVREPYRLRAPETGEKAVVVCPERCPSELPLFSFRDLAAEHVRHELVPIADAENGNIHIEDARIGTRASVLQYRRRTTGENDPRWLQCPYFSNRRIEGDDLGSNAEVAPPPRDEMRELAPEIHHKDHKMCESECGRFSWMESGEMRMNRAFFSNSASVRAPTYPIETWIPPTSWSTTLSSAPLYGISPATPSGMMRLLFPK